MLKGYKNRPDLFPGQTLHKVTKDGFSFLCLFCVMVSFSFVHA